MRIRLVGSAKVWRPFFEKFAECVDETEQPILSTDVVVYSYDDSGRSGPKARSLPGTRVLICGEPTNLTRAMVTGCSLLLDCKWYRPYMSRKVRMAYLPFYSLSFAERFGHVPQDLIKPLDWDPGVRTKFCAFLYWRSVSHREQIYDCVCRYRAVSALGRSRGANAQSAYQKDRFMAHSSEMSYMDIAVEKYRPYKFVLCVENESLPGYVTEKIINAMLAGCVPIYYGAPDIDKHFNPRSFVWIKDLSQQSLHSALEEIRRLDTHEEAYLQVLSEPWLRENRLSQFFDPRRTAEAALRMVAG